MRLPATLLLLALVCVAATSELAAQPTATPPLDTRVPTPDIAVLLPLSGEFRGVGQRALRSVAMAAEYFDDVVWRTYDTGPDAAAALNTAVAQGARVILGPIGEAETRLVAETASAQGTPVMSLCSVDGIEDLGPNVFRLRSSLFDQAYAIGAWAASRRDEIGPPLTFAVAAPETNWGTEGVLGFVAGVVAGGGIVTQVARYPDDRPDYSEVTAQLLGQRIARLDVSGDPWRAGPRSSSRRNTTETRAFEGLLVVDYDANVADLLPFLQFSGLIGAQVAQPVRLYGVSTWFGDALPLVGDLAAGSALVTSYHPDDPRGASEGFTLDYSDRYAEPATEFDAQVFDAAGFVFSLLNDAPALDASTLIDSAIDGHGFSGAAGRLFVDSAGGARREFGVWEVNGDGRVFPVYEIDADGTQR